MKRGEKPKILIADASKANRSALREILEGQYQIKEAEKAEEAAASYIEQTYELGAADFIPLPFHPAVVRQRAANAVALYESQGILVGMSQERARQNAMMADILGHIVEFRNQESRHHILKTHSGIGGRILRQLPAYQEEPSGSCWPPLRGWRRKCPVTDTPGRERALTV